MIDHGLTPDTVIPTGKAEKDAAGNLDTSASESVTLSFNSFPRAGSGTLKPAKRKSTGAPGSGLDRAGKCPVNSRPTIQRIISARGSSEAMAEPIQRPSRNTVIRSANR